MYMVEIEKVTSSDDGEMKKLCPMVEEAFALTMADAPEELKDFPVPKGEDIISCFESGMDLWKIYSNDNLAGGAVISIKNKNTAYLELYFIAGNIEGKGIGAKAWNAIENAYPNIKIWETATPYFQKRNIHFYVNKCGFHIVEFHNKWNPITENGTALDDEMFIFRKELI